MVSTMRPGQLKPNEFELAILACMTQKELSIAASIGQLHVLSREFTGVGSFTNFKVDALGDALEQPVGLDALIRMPGVPNGMGAELLLKGGKPQCLEVFTYGDNHWDGVFEGFSIEQLA